MLIQMCYNFLLDPDRIYPLLEDNFNINELMEKDAFKKNAVALREKYRTYYIEKNGRIIAFAIIYVYDEMTYLEYLVSDKQYRGQGYIYEIMLLLQKEYSNIVLAVDNEPDLRYYRRYKVDELKWRFQSPPLGEGKESLEYQILVLNNKHFSYQRLKDLLLLVFGCYDGMDAFFGQIFEGFDMSRVCEIETNPS